MLKTVIIKKGPYTGDTSIELIKEIDVNISSWVTQREDKNIKKLIKL